MSFAALNVLFAPILYACSKGKHQGFNNVICKTPWRKLRDLFFVGVITAGDAQACPFPPGLVAHACVAVLQSTQDLKR